MTVLAELLQQTRDTLDEPVAAQFTDAMLVRWLNEGTRDLARSTHFFKDTHNEAILANVSTLTLNPRILAVEHVYWSQSGDDRKIPLTARHWENMDQVWGAYQDQGSSDPRWFTVLGYSPNSELRMFPAPTTNGTLSLIVSVLPDEPDPDNFDPDVDTLDVPDSWFDTLVDYAEYKALRRDRDPRWQEARALYTEKRDGLIHTADMLAINREMVPSPSGGYLDAWLTEFDDWLV